MSMHSLSLIQSELTMTDQKFVWSRERGKERERERKRENTNIYNVYYSNKHTHTHTHTIEIGHVSSLAPVKL